MAVEPEVGAEAAAAAAAAAAEGAPADSRGIALSAAACHWPEDASGVPRRQSAAGAEGAAGCHCLEDASSASRSQSAADMGEETGARVGRVDLRVDGGSSHSRMSRLPGLKRVAGAVGSLRMTRVCRAS